MFAAGRGRDRRAGLLAALLILALVFCHGLFGGLHLVSGFSGVSASADGGLVGDVAGVHAQHAGASDGHGAPQDPAPGPATSDYYAAILVASFGAALGLLLWAVSGARGPLEGAMRGDGFVPAAEVPVLARGPDRRALLQVFRL